MHVVVGQMREYYAGGVEAISDVDEARHAVSLCLETKYLFIIWHEP